MNSSVPRDLALLIARVGLGVIFVAHGWQKLDTNGLDATKASFDQMGVPAPTLSAYYATFAELVGGAALILGAFTAVAGVVLFLDMVGALLTTHIDNGVFVKEGGFELVVALGVGALLLAVFGAGKFSIDGVGGSSKLARTRSLVRN